MPSSTDIRLPLWRRIVDRIWFVIWDQMLCTRHPAWERFFARRCPHLAGMIAYFGILSIIPAAFLFISALGFAGALENQGWIVEQLEYAIPVDGADTIVDTVESLRENSGSLGLVGLVGLIWGTTNFFSCMESALNIIHGVNNRHFFVQKAWVLFLMIAALVAMVAGTLLVAVLLPILREIDQVAVETFHVPLDDRWISVVATGTFAFLFFLSCYRFLPNTVTSVRDGWRGALVAALAFEASIHLLPAWVGQNRGGVVLSAFAGAFIVLIWFYLMAFIMLVGGVYAWWHREKRVRRAAAAAGLDADDGFSGEGVS